MTSRNGDRQIVMIVVIIRLKLDMRQTEPTSVERIKFHSKIEVDKMKWVVIKLDGVSGANTVYFGT